MESTAPAPTLYLALELGSTKWTLAFTISAAQAPRLRTIAAGDLAALSREIAMACVRFDVPITTPVRSYAAVMKPAAMGFGCTAGWTRTPSAMWWSTRRALK
jgi:hypothetical protein